MKNKHGGHVEKQAWEVMWKNKHGRSCGKTSMRCHVENKHGMPCENKHGRHVKNKHKGTCGKQAKLDWKQLFYYNLEDYVGICSWNDR